MSSNKQNDVAAALAALAGGAIPSESETPSGGIPSETTVFSPPAAAAPAPTLAPPAGSTPAGSAASPSFAKAARASLPTPPLAPKVPAHTIAPGTPPPPARIRPASEDRAPRVRPSAPQRSAAPTAPPPPQTSGKSDLAPSAAELPDELPELYEDEETIAAAPDASAFARSHLHKSAQSPLYASLFYRRTIIPILLTCGVMLPAIGLWSMIDPGAPLAAIGVGVELFLIALGLLLLALGFLNAFQVKHILETAGKKSG